MTRIAIVFVAAALAAPSFAVAQPAAPPAAAVMTAVGAVAAAGADFAALRRSGATSVKLTVDWSVVEPTKGQFTWKSVDDTVDAATAAGLSVVAILAYTPKWASLATGIELSNRDIYSRQPPRRVADWEAFVAAAVGRYKTKVKDWQIWTALNLPLFRGTASEYLTLVRAARAKSKAADPASRIILATPQGMDLTSIRRAVAEAGTAFDAVSLNPLGLSPEALMRPLGSIRERVLAKQPKRIWIEWDPRAIGDRQTWAGQFVKVLTLARAFGVERLYWAAPPSAEVEGAKKVFDERVDGKTFTGYLDRPGAVAMAFGDAPTTLIAWSRGTEAQLQVDASASVYAISGEPRHGTAAGERLAVTVGPDPVVITDVGPVVAAEAKTTLQAHGLPLPPAERDYAQATEVKARLGKANVEDGLYNMPFRSRKNGAVDVVEVDGQEAVRTNASKDIVFIYFDVDDSFLYYVDNRATVEVFVEVHGASAPQQLGFNLLYDSLTGYRFTPWQWVEAKPGWVTYTFKLTDAGFSNTWGWDFAINAGGNRKEDLTVRSVTVRKVPKP